MKKKKRTVRKTTRKEEVQPGLRLAWRPAWRRKGDSSGGHDLTDESCWFWTETVIFSHSQRESQFYPSAHCFTLNNAVFFISETSRVNRQHGRVGRAAKRRQRPVHGGLVLQVLQLQQKNLCCPNLQSGFPSNSGDLGSWCLYQITVTKDPSPPFSL